MCLYDKDFKVGTYKINKNQKIRRNPNVTNTAKAAAIRGKRRNPVFWITIAELQLRTIAQKKHTFMQSSCQSSLNTRQASSLALTGVLKKPHKGIVLCIDETAGSEKTKKAGKEAYCLTITPEGATVSAYAKEGLFNGVQTLRQLIIQYGICLQCLYIEDYPQIPVRGWFMDVTRGRIPKLSYLKEMADRCSLYKINQMHLYIEHTVFI